MSPSKAFPILGKTVTGKLLQSTWLNITLLVLVLVGGVYTNYIFSQHYGRLNALYEQRFVIIELDDLITSNNLLLYGLLYEDATETIPELLARNEDLHSRFARYQDLAYESENITDESFALEYESLVVALRTAIVKTVTLYRGDSKLDAREHFKKEVKNLTGILHGVAETSFYTKQLEIDTATTQLKSIQTIVLIGFIIAIVLIIGLGTAINLRLREAIRRPLAGLMQATREISSGNLTYKPDIATNDEFGALGESFGAMAASLDKALREMSAYNQELEAKNAELERFTYTVSHDLKSPLITIRGFIGLLEKDAADCNAERVNEDVTQIKNATNDMQHLLDDLLELSRVGRVVNPPQSINFNDLVAQAIKHVTGRIEQNNVEVRVAENLPTLYGDRVRLLEVLQNLLDNAVKFVNPEQAPLVEVSAWQDAEGVGCCVQDNGIGIDPRYHEKVFGLFERLDNETEGTGVGLALVKRIIEVHGGRIWVESSGKGEGARFCFVIPTKEASKVSVQALRQI